MAGPDEPPAASAPEFSHRVPLERVSPHGSDHRLVADSAARARLAARFGLLSLDRLEADLVLRRTADGAHLAGRVVADLTQACVVSGEPVSAHVDEALEVAFTTALPDGEEVELDADALDRIPFDGTAVDLGEAVAETLVLALDPYPRAEEARLAEARRLLLSEEEAAARLAAAQAAASPFAVLKPPGTDGA